MTGRLQVLQQVDDLRANADVEGAGGLVADDESGFERDGAGHSDSLPLSPRELVRIAVHDFRAQTHLRQEQGHFFAQRGAVCHAVYVQCLADNLLDRHAGIERTVGVLKDDLHPPALFAKLLAVESQDVVSFEFDDPRGGRDESQERATHRRLAAAAFADEPQRLPLADRERDAVDRFDVFADPREQASPHREMLFQITNDKKRH